MKYADRWIFNGLSKYKKVGREEEASFTCCSILPKGSFTFLSSSSVSLFSPPFFSRAETSRHASFSRKPPSGRDVFSERKKVCAKKYREKQISSSLPFACRQITICVCQLSQSIDEKSGHNLHNAQEHLRPNKTLRTLYDYKISLYLTK